MGTLLAATLPVGESDVHARHVATIFETAGVCEDVMSRHRPDAGVSRLNARAGDPEGIVSAELARVLALARRLSIATDGAFDPTITPVFEAWRRASARGRMPSARRLRATLGLVGCRRITIAGSRVSLERAGMAIDLGGARKRSRARSHRGSTATRAVRVGHAELRGVEPARHRPPSGRPVDGRASSPGPRCRR